MKVSNRKIIVICVWLFARTLLTRKVAANGKEAFMSPDTRRTRRPRSIRRGENQFSRARQLALRLKVVEQRKDGNFLRLGFDFDGDIKRSPKRRKIFRVDHVVMALGFGSFPAF